MKKTGLMLINLGTPDRAEAKEVKRFLAEFLMDGRVVNLPFLLRAMLVYGVILPFRVRKTLKAYQTIWDAEHGSPLLFLTQNLVKKLQAELGENVEVALAMRYGNPSIESALRSLMEKGCEKIVVFPQYPQYAASTSLSSKEKVFAALSKLKYFPEVKILGDFYDNSFYLEAQAAIAQEALATNDDFHVLFSFHGLPQKHVVDTGCNGCPGVDPCPRMSKKNQFCYRAQCFHNARELSNLLNLKENQYSIGFQSRLGRLPWIQPYTDQVILPLAEKGIEKLAVICPSFVTDCLETLEEIGIALKEKWLSNGGKEFILIPCLNDQSVWVQSIKQIIK